MVERVDDGLPCFSGLSGFYHFLMDIENAVVAVGNVEIPRTVEEITIFDVLQRIAIGLCQWQNMREVVGVFASTSIVSRLALEAERVASLWDGKCVGVE